MKQYALENGLKVIEDNRTSDSVTILFSVNLGSNDEKDGVHGICHFIEHLLFEGTRNYGSARQLSDEIESIGGEMNAYTDNIRTTYYIKVLKKHYQKAIEILSEIICNPLLRKEDMEKERNVILKEINMLHDDPRHYQWILFSNTMFKKHPAHYPPYGNVQDIKKISASTLRSYFVNNYSAKNSSLCIVGDVDSRELINRYFGGLRQGSFLLHAKHSEPPQSKIRIIKKKRKILNSYLVHGYRSVPREHPDSYVLDVIQAILGKGQSGWMFDAIRGKRGLAYEVGVHNEASTDYGFFAVYLSADKSKMREIIQLILEQFKNLNDISDKELASAKGYIEGKYILDNEDTHTRADQLSFWNRFGDAAQVEKYLSKISSVNRRDIIKVAKKYFSSHYTLSIIEQL